MRVDDLEDRDKWRSLIYHGDIHFNQKLLRETLPVVLLEQSPVEYFASWLKVFMGEYGNS